MNGLECFMKLFGSHMKDPRVAEELKYIKRDLEAMQAIREFPDANTSPRLLLHMADFWDSKSLAVTPERLAEHCIPYSPEKFRLIKRAIKEEEE